MAAIGKFVLWGKENLCLIRAREDVLALETLFVAEDVRATQAEIEEAVEETKVKKPELDLARQVIESLAGEFEPADFENEYRRELRAMLDAKLAGETITAPEPVAQAPVVDLMEALKRSVADVRGRRRPSLPQKREEGTGPALAPRPAPKVCVTRSCFRGRGSERLQLRSDQKKRRRLAAPFNAHGSSVRASALSLTNRKTNRRRSLARLMLCLRGAERR